MCWNKHNKRSGKHSGKCIKSGNNECRKCPKNAKNIRKNIPCDNDKPMKEVEPDWSEWVANPYLNRMGKWLAEVDLGKPPSDEEKA